MPSQSGKHTLFQTTLRFLRPKLLKTVHFGAAQIYLAHERQYPPPLFLVSALGRGLYDVFRGP